MACFLVSAAEAAVVSAVERQTERHEEAHPETASRMKIPMSRKLGWLTRMLWGGSALLLFEHVWHGEIVPWFPFLTAMADPADAAAMFGEMASVGVCMALLITAVWGVMCFTAERIASRDETETPESAEGTA